MMGENGKIVRVRRSGSTGPKAAHKLVADTAKGFARAVYEANATASDEFYAKNPSMEAYVEQSWGMFLETARETLGKMLNPASGAQIGEKEKEEIFEALTLDEQFRASRPKVRWRM